MIKFRTFWLLMLICITNAIGKEIFAPISKDNDDWWRNTIIYQVYPRSFQDSNNDGIGDLKGITRRLDHFVDLGIETLWVGPIFKSPQDDMGYDIENYTLIDPLFGTMDDFEELVREMNKRNLKLITDLVPNHSSYKCEWFLKSIKREGKYKDYYVWRDAKNQAAVLKDPSVKPVPPNNWASIFGYPSWTWNDERKQFYYHQFSPQQPDFNIRNPEIHKELNDVVEFWLNRGVSGFRIDAVRHLYEDAQFRDEPYLKGREGGLSYNDMIHIYTADLPEVIDIIAEWRKTIDDYSKRKQDKFTRISATESYADLANLMRYYGNSTHPGTHIPFNFKLLDVDGNNMIGTIDFGISRWLEHLPKGSVANWVMENHDNSRMSTKYGAEIVPIFNAIKLSLPGVDVTYYGSEIGMENSFVRTDQLVDKNIAVTARTVECRDYYRSPMQWDDSINAGFTKAKKTWIPVHPNYYKLNVEAQKKTPNSHYNFYKRMSQLRKTDTFKYGGLETFNVTESLYALRRFLPEHESYLVVANFGSETETVDLSSAISNLQDKLYVYIGSENSAYFEGNVVSSKISSEHPLQLRPKSVVVLTDKLITTDESKKNPSSGSAKNSLTFISVFGAILFAMYFA